MTLSEEQRAGHNKKTNRRDEHRRIESIRWVIFMHQIRVSDDVYDYLKEMIDDEHEDNSNMSDERNANGETVAHRPSFSDVISHLIEDREGKIGPDAMVKRQATRIKELEDALVEGLTNFLHYRASCYDPARRCPYAKECDDCSTWDACGHVEMFRSEARRQLQAEGKIGPDAKPRVWQITEERKAAIWHAVAVLKENDPDDEHLWDEEIAVLRAMLTEAE